MFRTAAGLTMLDESAASKLRTFSERL